MTAILGRLATYSGQEIKWTDALNSELCISPVEKYHTFQDTPPILPDADMLYPIPTPGVTKVL
jgi:hypothetical protein